MTLKQWFAEMPRQDRRAAEQRLAALCGVHPQTVRRWRYGLRVVGLARMPAITRATAGAVTADAMAERVGR